MITDTTTPKETNAAKQENGGGWMRRLVRLSFWYFLRWLRGPVVIAQGLAQTISLGCWEPSWILKTEGWFLDYSWEVHELIRPNADVDASADEKPPTKKSNV
jgi:hypothetical protein